MKIISYTQTHSHTHMYLNICHAGENTLDGKGTQLLAGGGGTVPLTDHVYLLNNVNYGNSSVQGY